jgi:hypothetical protein
MSVLQEVSNYVECLKEVVAALEEMPTDIGEKAQEVLETFSEHCPFPEDLQSFVENAQAYLETLEGAVSIMETVKAHAFEKRSFRGQMEEDFFAAEKTKLMF